MYTLYGFKGAGSVAVEMALHLMAAEYRLVTAANWEPSSALGELQRINPLAQIPTLVLPEGGVITESAAILIHLGLTADPGLLLPADPNERAQAIRGLVYIAANCYSCIPIIDYPERFTTARDKASLDRIRDATRARLHMHWKIFADTFAAAPFLNGQAPGALDFLAVVISKWSGARAHLKENRPSFHEVLLRIEHHPSVAAIVEAHWAR